ncbi:MAG: archaetidylserine decarboxylase [Gammaproteobacteria bacterium]|nr:archaetidylserine decarboxylase [Gammaproteobacteria bacterium]
MNNPIQQGNKDKLKIWLFYLLPHHLVSRLVFFVTRQQGPVAQPLIKWFIRKFGVDMSDSECSDPGGFKTFNEFFTRTLKQEARPVVPGENTIACPVDGTVSAAGNIEEQSIFQAKGHQYTVRELLGGDASLSALFNNGRFATVYLAPYNYHRIHMPVSGVLKKMIHVPGRLFSVAPWTVSAIPRLFARNERVVCLFSTPAGPIAMVLVGAINVAAIETVWAGLITPPKGKRISQFDYSHTRRQYLKGAEMGRFNMGSTVILLTAGNVEWLQKIRAGQVMKMGEMIGHFPSPKSST